MSNTDPFVSGEALSTIVKDLERRWGLTLVSFLPPAAQERIVQLQDEISNRLGGCGDASARQGGLYLEFYQPSHLHCTHLTLTRSDPREPVRAERLVKAGHSLFELFRIVHHATSRIQPIKVELDILRITYDGLGILLLGKCADEDAGRNREFLLGTLNQALPDVLDLSRRSWDTDSSRYREMHCRFGFLKRALPQGYDAFVDEIQGIEFAPLAFVMEGITLVHHRYRSLAFPQEGSFHFPLGRKVEVSEEEFAHRLSLA